MTSSIREETFDGWAWHDNALYGIRLDPADPDAGDWRSDLILSIDHIVEWLRDDAGSVRFRVAPAVLTFHGVGSLSISVDWHDQMLHDMSIHEIGRQPLAHPSGNAGLDWYRWHIALNWPDGGALQFGASGYTQRLLAEPVLRDQQALTPGERRRLVAR